MSNALDITDVNFEQEVKKSEIPVLVDFFATWCGPCKMMGPVLDNFEKASAGTVKVVKVDVDQNPELAAQFGVMSIPTLVVFKDGVAKAVAVGTKTIPELNDLVLKA